MEFEWDAEKAAANKRKHGVSFEEAVTTFDDPLAKLFYDAEHSGGEDRYLLIGASYRQRLLVVCHTDRSGKTRIISARKADRHERAMYDEG